MNTVIFFVLCGVCVALATDKHMICRQIGNVFKETAGPGQLQDKTIRFLRGPPGMRGRAGPPGVADCAKVNSTIRTVINGLCEMESMMEETFDKLSEEFTSVLLNLPDKILERQGFCDIKFRRSCFWLVYDGITFFNFSQARAECRRHRGRIAIIYTKLHYERIVDYIRREITDVETWADVWLGMKISPETKSVIKTKKTSETHVTWYPGYPSSTATHTNVVLHVRLDTSFKYQGMFNDRPEYDTKGVLCEM